MIVQSKRESFDGLKSRLRAKAAAVNAFTGNVQWPDYSEEGQGEEKEEGDEQEHRAPIPHKLMTRQGGRRNLLMADLIGAAAAHSLMVQQPLSQLSPPDAALQRKRMFVWLLKWKRKESAQAAHADAQMAMKELVQCCTTVATVISGLLSAWGRNNPKAIIYPTAIAPVPAAVLASSGPIPLSASQSRLLSAAVVAAQGASNVVPFEQNQARPASSSVTVRRNQPTDATFSWTSVDPALAMAGLVSGVVPPKAIDFGSLPPADAQGFAWPNRPALHGKARPGTANRSVASRESAAASVTALDLDESLPQQYPAWGPMPALSASLPNQPLRAKQASYVLGAGPKPLPYLSDQDAVELARNTLRHTLASTDGARAMSGTHSDGLLRRPGSRASAAVPAPADAIVPLTPRQFITELSGSGFAIPVNGDASHLFDSIFTAAYDYAYGFWLKAAAAVDIGTSHAVAAKQSHLFALSVVGVLNPRADGGKSRSPSPVRGAGTSGHLYKPNEAPVGDAVLRVGKQARTYSDGNAAQDFKMIGDSAAVFQVGEELVVAPAEPLAVTGKAAGCSPQRSPRSPVKELEPSAAYLAQLKQHQVDEFMIEVPVGDESAPAPQQPRGRQVGRSVQGSLYTSSRSRSPTQRKAITITSDRPKGREGTGVRVSGYKRVEVPVEHVSLAYGGEAGAVPGVPPDRYNSTSFSARFPARLPYYVEASHPHDIREPSQTIEGVLRGEVTYDAAQQQQLQQQAAVYTGDATASGSQLVGIRSLVGAADRTPMKPTGEGAAVGTVGASKSRPGRRYSAVKTGAGAGAGVEVRNYIASLLELRKSVVKCYDVLQEAYAPTPSGATGFGSFPPPSPMRSVEFPVSSKEDGDELRLPAIAKAPSDSRKQVPLTSVSVKWAKSGGNSQTL